MRNNNRNFMELLSIIGLIVSIIFIYHATMIQETISILIVGLCLMLTSGVGYGVIKNEK